MTCLEPPGQWYIVVVDEGSTPTCALSRRGGPEFDGPWRLLTRDEAEKLCIAWNASAPETEHATVVEVYRSEFDPDWKE